MGEIRKGRLAEQASRGRTWCERLNGVVIQARERRSMNGQVGVAMAAAGGD